MLLNSNLNKIARKELNLFFSSPIAYLFLGVFVAITLFVFFWGESFFARNIADVRPMFEWMPVLLILLSAALTMRMWSEERRSGTLEHVITLPVNPWQFVLGKFAACKTLLVIALALTLPLPITVSIMANLDWGPVISAYIATILLGSSYLAIGLFVSSRSDNQIVSLIITVLVCGLFYMLGSPTITGLFGNEGGELLRAFGSGSRFESITRGVIDIRDLVYYLSITIIFLTLNRYTLEKDRWASDGDKAHHTRWKLYAGLIIVNAIVANIWLAPLGKLRIDTTEGKIFSINDATRNYLAQLQEPLLIRGYFSAKTHPLLAPLVPEVQDLLKEYQAEAKGNIRIEFIDPAKDAEAEEEAGSKYGIRPTPFRVADRYQAAVVNSYFNLLIQYGDEYKVLSFSDLIEVKSGSTTDIEVKLRNPEYDITNAIKQVLYAYQSGGNLFTSIQDNIQFTGYISNPKRLPESLAKFVPDLQQTLQTTQTESENKFSFNIVDPDANGGIVATQIQEDFGFQPMASSLFDTNTFYFYLVLSNGDLNIQIPLPDDLSKEGFERTLEAGLKRFASGFTKTIGLVAPQANPYAAQMGQPVGASFQVLQQSLSENMTVKNTDISSGKVPEDIDLLAIMSPENLSSKAVFAIDQFLMQGGTVVIASSPFKATFSQQGLNASRVTSGLEPWLAHHGMTLEPKFVLDTQSTAFPVPVNRQVGMFTVQEMAMVDYPYFVEVREQGLNADNPVTANTPEITIPWASPITIDADKNAQRTVEEWIKSSPSSWLSDDMAIGPDTGEKGLSKFNPGEAKGEQVLAAMVSGTFSSYYTDKESPLLAKEEATAKTTEENDEAGEPEEVISSIIKHSSESAKIIVLASNSFAEDRITGVMSSMQGNQYAAPFQLLASTAEWSLEDQGLLSIRARSHFNRTLPPQSIESRQFWEFLNYGLVLFGLLIIYLVRLTINARKQAHYRAILAKPTEQ